MDDPLSELRLADVSTFLAVHRARSITGAARVLGVTPSQVSKAVARLERMLDVSLLVRGARGISISQEGLAFVPRLDEIVTRIHGLRSDERRGLELTIAAPSYLHAFFVPFIAAALPQHRLRCLSMPPALVRAYAVERLFDLAFTIGEERFPEAWGRAEIGPLRRGLFASPALAKRLGKPVSEAALAPHAFISPVYVVNGQAMPVEDGCPLPRGRRRLGPEVETIGLGLELAARSEQLVFGPTVAAQGHLRAGTLAEIEVADWAALAPELIRVYTSGELLARVQQAVVDSCRAALDTVTG